MSLEYVLVSKESKETFDLGSGEWFRIFNAAREPFEFKKCFSSKEHLSQLIKNHIMKGKNRDEDCPIIAETLWSWAVGKKCYFGDDRGEMLDVNGQDLEEISFETTGSVYKLKYPNP